ncbi:hypothetical protein K474DRAFT_1143386 [Panus rudis PR-1116 ss-1]|nr:hypothetical protein K474DRAFT_1143386 [Panus rudis PR-1116 ss-1]
MLTSEEPHRHMYVDGRETAHDASVCSEFCKCHALGQRWFGISSWPGSVRRRTSGVAGLEDGSKVAKRDWEDRTRTAPPALSFIDGCAVQKGRRMTKHAKESLKRTSAQSRHLGAELETDGAAVRTPVGARNRGVRGAGREVGRGAWPGGGDGRPEGSVWQPMGSREAGREPYVIAGGGGANRRGGVTVTWQ